MLKNGTGIRLMVLLAAPALATAQNTQVKPSPRQPATNAPKLAAPLPQTASPDSRRFVTNENFFRAGSRTQTTNPAGSQSVLPSGPTPVVAGVVRANSPAVSPGAMAPQATNPAATAFTPAQPALPRPAMTSTASSPATDHEGSAAVDYASGQLTVLADRAPLGHVLKLIANKTGAVVDLAPELQQEPVMAKLGPGPVQEVLTGLLASPRIDYIVFGTGDEPGSLQRIVVRRRQSFGNSPVGAFRNPQPQQQAAEGAETDSNGQIASRRIIPGQNEVTQDQRMEDWKNQRAQMLEAEMKQQAHDRENDKLQPQEPPVPQEPPQNQDNPPQF
jgi:hypothetical protein